MDRQDETICFESGPYCAQQGMMESGPESQLGLPRSTRIQELFNSPLTLQPNIERISKQPAIVTEPSFVVPPQNATVVAPSTVVSTEPPKRTRGRPRKYGPDGKVALALPPPSSTHSAIASPTHKRGRGRPPGSGKKQQFSLVGQLPPSSTGIGFTPHVITVLAGEDILTKLISFSQQGPRAITILSANGAIASATLRNQTPNGGAATYEGRYEILCLKGSCMLANQDGSHYHPNDLCVSLAGSDGKVVGGGVAGMLIAASPVQMVVGSFLLDGIQVKNKTMEGLDTSEGIDNLTVDTQATPISIVPSQTPILTSSSGVWCSPRPTDGQNIHANIDLMRG